MEAKLLAVREGELNPLVLEIYIRITFIDTQNRHVDGSVCV